MKTRIALFLGTLMAAAAVVGVASADSCACGGGSLALAWDGPGICQYGGWQGGAYVIRYLYVEDCPPSI